MTVDFTSWHDHGILVIEQLGSTADHRDWDMSQDHVHAEPDSLYVAVLPDMEGEVRTAVRQQAQVPPEGHVMVFRGRLETSSGVLVIGDSDRNVEVRLPLYSNSVGIEVFVDQPGFATRALVILQT